MDLRALAAIFVLVACGDNRVPTATVDANVVDALAPATCTPMWQAPAGCTATFPG
jgi:hypothetical protein